MSMVASCRWAPPFLVLACLPPPNVDCLRKPGTTRSEVWSPTMDGHISAHRPEPSSRPSAHSLTQHTRRTRVIFQLSLTRSHPPSYLLQSRRTRRNYHQANSLRDDRSMDGPINLNIG
ncbi:hypothetical protein LZ30DRAFT_48525 [Colletotrichum cereale]|nr:hypothetical protein LZ30DRAFT_48525 [Colletotrichum cereale]